MSNESLSNQIKKLRIKGKTWIQVGDMLEMKPERARAIARRSDWYDDLKENTEEVEVEAEIEDEYVKREYNTDGSISSHLKKKMAEKKLLSDDDLITIHGYDPIYFELTGATSNEWSVTNGQGEQYWNFQSKIKVKPKTIDGMQVQKIIETICNYVTSFDTEVVDDEKLPSTLFLPLPDLHFGENTAEEYSEYQDSIMRLLENQYESVVVALLGDLFNANDFHSMTIHQTRVSDTDIPNAWEEAILFLFPIIQKATEMSNNVKVVYSRGNHSETLDWTFTQTLKYAFETVYFDDGLEQLKCVLVDNNAIYLTHGHVKKKNFVQLAATLYPKEWATATNRILFTGHFHFIKSEDLTGMVHYQLPTPSKDTDYEEERLFLGSQKGIHAFELGDDRVNAIYYL